MRLIDADELKTAFLCGESVRTECVRATIDSMPTLEQKRKKGKWKGYNDGDPNWQRDDGSPIFLICSECHETVINNGSAHWNFCPNCGSDMRGE